MPMLKNRIQLRYRYRLHDIQLQLIGEDSIVLGCIREILQDFGLQPSTPKAEAPQLHLTCTARSDSRIPAEAREIGLQDGIRAWSAGEQVFLSCDAHIACLSPRSGTGEVVIPALACDVRKDLLIYSLMLLLRPRGYFGLHASGVVREGAGYLWIAGRRAGKSTHVYSLVRRGWAYLGDDALLIRFGDNQVEALSLRRDLYLDPALVDCFPELEEVTASLSANGKKRIAVQKLYPQASTGSCIPQILVFPEITLAKRSRIEPLEPAAVVPWLISQSIVFSLGAGISAHLELLCQLALQARSYRLFAGQDLKEDPGLVADLLKDFVVT